MKSMFIYYILRSYNRFYQYYSKNKKLKNQICMKDVELEKTVKEYEDVFEEYYNLLESFNKQEGYIKLDYLVL